MTGKRISWALAAATLLLVGAGCSADQQTTIETSLPPHQQNVNANADVNVNLKVNVPTSVDGSVDAIIKDGSDETAAQKDLENDASDVDSDNTSAKAFGTASYDIETK